MPTEQQFTLGVNAPTPLAPGVRTKIITTPQTPFKIERLIIPDQYKDAIIHGLEVGGEDQLVPGTALPAAVFSQTAPSTPLDIATASVGQRIVLTVERPNGGPFSAAFFGTAASPPAPEPLEEEAEKAAILLGLKKPKNAKA